MKIIRVKHSQNQLIQSGSPLQLPTMVRLNRLSFTLVEEVCYNMPWGGGDAGEECLLCVFIRMIKEDRVYEPILRKLATEV